MSFIKQKSSKKSLSMNKGYSDKENQLVNLQGQQDICQILSSLHNSIQQNKNQIISLKQHIQQGNQPISTRKCQNKTKYYQQLIDQSVNDATLTLKDKRQSSLYHKDHFLVNKLQQLIQHFQQFQSNMKINEKENQLYLEKRLSQKGQKSQIQKSINLSKLLVIQIEQIKDKFKHNQNLITQNQKSIKQLEQNYQHIIPNLSQTNQKYKNQLTQINNIQNFKNYILPSMKEQIIKNNESITKKLQSFKEQIKNISFNHQIQKLTQKIHEHLNQNIDQKIKQMIILQEVKKQKQNIELNKKIQSTLEELSKSTLEELSKQTTKSKNQFEITISKRIQNIQKLYTKKKDFLDNSEEVQKHLNRLTQTISRSNSSISTKIQHIQKKQLSHQILHQNNIQSLFNQINQSSQEVKKQISTKCDQIFKNFSKYPKIETMKKYFQAENQKVHKIIDLNFQQQKSLNEVLCAENILGRWLWQGQELKGGNLVNWDKEVINTLPQNFKFSSQKPNIIEISNGGIYKFQLGFYAKQKPTIQVLINGKVVISAVNSSSYVIHHSSGKLKRIQPTQISGLTLVDFFMIPQNSRIAIAYNGESKGQGFLNIHRL